MPTEVIYITESRNYVDAELAWVSWPPHRYSEPIVPVEVLLHVVKALETAEHVLDRNQAASVFLKSCFDIH